MVKHSGNELRRSGIGEDLCPARFIAGDVFPAPSGKLGGLVPIWHGGVLQEDARRGKAASGGMTQGEGRQVPRETLNKAKISNWRWW